MVEHLTRFLSLQLPQQEMMCFFWKTNANLQRLARIHKKCWNWLMHKGISFVLFQVVRANLLTECKCHGLSGTCKLKTCWKRLAPFDMVGTELKLKYRQAVRVEFKQRKLKERVGDAYRPVSREDRKMVYLEPSPDYCVRNLTAGSYGMLGRTCNSEDMPTDSCIDLCNSCNMRHKTVNHYEEVDCRCKFFWCCEFRCDKCTKQTSITTCVNR